MPFEEMWPRDAFGFFEAPVVTFTALAAATATQVAALNPDRMALILSANGQCFAAPTNKVSGSQGLVLQTTLPPFVWTFKDHGPLSQVAWFAFAPGAGVTFTVIEVILQRNPDDTGEYNVYASPKSTDSEQGDSPYEYVPPGVKPAPGFPDILSPSNQQDYYKLWQACCAGRRRPATLPGGKGGHFDAGGIWHADTR